MLKKTQLGIFLITFLFMPIPTVAQTVPVLESSQAQAKKSVAKEIVEGAIQKIESQYVNTDFINQKEWQTVRSRALSRSYTSVEQAYTEIRQMLQVLQDPYTRLVDPNELITPDLAGIGLQLERQKGQVTVRQVIEKSPALRAGIQSQDVLLQVDGYTPSGSDALNQALTRLRGKVGTPVSLTLQRGSQKLNLQVVRAAVTINTVNWKIRDTDIGKVGYIRLAQFSPSSSREMREAT